MRRPITRARVGITLVAIVILVVLVSRTQGTGGGKATPSPTPPATVAAAVATPSPGTSAATPSSTPLVPPTPAIALPHCPSGTAAGVDNAARFGFCTPVGWGAWNDNNSLPFTQMLKPRPGGNPIILPTDFARIAIVIVLNATPPAELPAACKAAPNDTVDTFPAHHCVSTLDPKTNNYQGVQAQYWLIDLPAGRTFYVTSVAAADASPADQVMISTIVHNLKPNGT